MDEDEGVMQESTLEQGNSRALVMPISSRHPSLEHETPHGS